MFLLLYLSLRLIRDDLDPRSFGWGLHIRVVLFLKGGQGLVEVADLPELL